MYDHDLPDKSFTSDELNQEFTYEGITYIYSKLKKKRIYIVASTFRGKTWNAVHYYARIYFERPECILKETGEPSGFFSSGFPEPEKFQEEIDITYIRDTPLIERGGEQVYDTGERCTRFDDVKMMHDRITEEIIRLFSNNWEVHWHDRCIHCPGKECPEAPTRDNIQGLFE